MQQLEYVCVLLVLVEPDAKMVSKVKATLKHNYGLIILYKISILIHDE